MRPRRDSTAQSNTVARRVWDIDVAGPALERQHPKRYPPISSIPRTSHERLLRALPPADQPAPTEPVPVSSEGAIAGQDTVLYLAYGSNLAAETFLGTRKIRPISQVNVSAPSLRLTFDLPGLPYKEPCFANTAPRKVPKPPVDLPLPPSPPVPSPPRTRAEVGDWDKGLIGVVYEVTPSDYARIVATEGGGSSYHDILVPCLLLPASVGVPEKPPVPELPRPFLAHTLYAPRLPDNLHDGDDGDDEIEYPNLPPWLRRLLLPVRRPEPDYAQPSLRYLDLLRTGAREHDLPAEYQAYLDALQPYTPTTWRQKVGAALFVVFWSPMFVVVFGLARWLADDRGRTPAWLGAGMTLVFNLVWLAYDAVFKPLFGEGERTVEEEEEGGAIRLGDDDGAVGVSRTWRRKSSQAGGSLRYSDEAVEESVGEK